MGPGSTAHHYVLRCARDTEGMSCFHFYLPKYTSITRSFDET